MSTRAPSLACAEVAPAGTEDGRGPGGPQAARRALWAEVRATEAVLPSSLSPSHSPGPCRFFSPGVLAFSS